MAAAKFGTIQKNRGIFYNGFLLPYYSIREKKDFTDVINKYVVKGTNAELHKNIRSFISLGRITTQEQLDKALEPYWQEISKGSSKQDENIATMKADYKKDIAEQSGRLQYSRDNPQKKSSQANFKEYQRRVNESTSPLKRTQQSLAGSEAGAAAIGKAIGSFPRATPKEFAEAAADLENIKDDLGTGAYKELLKKLQGKYTDAQGKIKPDLTTDEVDNMKQLIGEAEEASNQPIDYTDPDAFTDDEDIAGGDDDGIYSAGEAPDSEYHPPDSQTASAAVAPVASNLNRGAGSAAPPDAISQQKIANQGAAAAAMARAAASAPQPTYAASHPLFDSVAAARAAQLKAASRGSSPRGGAGAAPAPAPAPAPVPPAFSPAQAQAAANLRQGLQAQQGVIANLQQRLAPPPVPPQPPAQPPLIIGSDTPSTMTDGVTPQERSDNIALQIQEQEKGDSGTKTDDNLDVSKYGYDKQVSMFAIQEDRDFTYSQTLVKAANPNIKQGLMEALKMWGYTIEIMKPKTNDEAEALEIRTFIFLAKEKYALERSWKRSITELSDMDFGGGGGGVMAPAPAVAGAGGQPPAPPGQVGIITQFQNPQPLSSLVAAGLARPTMVRRSTPSGRQSRRQSRSGSPTSVAGAGTGGFISPALSSAVAGAGGGLPGGVASQADIDAYLASQEESKSGGGNRRRLTGFGRDVGFTRDRIKRTERIPQGGQGVQRVRVAAPQQARPPIPKSRRLDTRPKMNVKQAQFKLRKSRMNANLLFTNLTKQNPPL